MLKYILYTCSIACAAYAGLLFANNTSMIYALFLAVFVGGLPFFAITWAAMFFLGARLAALREKINGKL